MLRKILLVSTPIIIYFAGYLLLNFYDFFGICLGGEILTHKAFPEPSCWGGLSGTAHAIKFGALYLFPVSILLSFASINTFKVWGQKFAIWFIPLSLVLITIQPRTPDSFDPSEPGRIVLSIWLGTLFLIVSALIIFFKNKKKSP